MTGGGQAVAGVLGTEEMMASSTTHLGGTYAWEPAACAGALAGLDLLADGTVLENVAQLESIARAELVP